MPEQMDQMVETGAFTSLSKQYGRLVSLSMPCPKVTLAQFLQASQGQPRFFLVHDPENVAFAGAGIALEVMEWGAERFDRVYHHALELFADAQVLDERELLAAPRLFGGFSFRDAFAPDNAWADFTPAHFVLPHYQFARHGDQSWLTINAHVPYGENPQSIAPDLREALAAKIVDLATVELVTAQQATLADVRYPMDYPTWEKHITDATRRMSAGEFAKIVLARVAELNFDQAVNVDAALAYLANQYADTYRFLFEPLPGRAFYGATPELLAQVQGQSIKTMALAGSIARGETPEEDDILAQSLLNSEKDRYEQALVTEAIQARLTPLTSELNVQDAEIMRLGNIQHLYSPIAGKLHQRDGILSVLSQLHPTPALGGSPRRIALSHIGDYEPVPRGWYAAPVGWIDRNLDGQFVVAIRSAVAQAKRVWLYAGAGIVNASEPRKEWDEIALKFRPMLRAHDVSSDNL